MSLSNRDRVVLDTLLPPMAHPGLPYGLFDAGFDSFYADFQATANLSLRFGFHAALFTAAWVAPLLIAKLPPISLHDRATRERALSALAGSRFYGLRQMVLVLKAVACFCYGADTAVRDAVGFPLQHDDPRRTRSGGGAVGR